MPISKLSDFDRSEIARRAHAGEATSDLAVEYDITPGRVSQIKRNSSTRTLQLGPCIIYEILPGGTPIERGRTTGPVTLTIVEET